jgi:cell filamentation protein
MSARDGLPDPRRHAIDQTIAAERLEGWRPTDDHVDALVRLLCDEVPFGEYLAAYRARYPSAPPPPPRDYRQIFRRNRPYLIPGTTVLRNNFGVDTQTVLSDLEFVATAGRMVGWHRMLAEGAIGVHDVDVRAIHQHLFADVYPWAGNYRVTELRRGDSVFAWQSSIGRLMALLGETARALATNGGGLGQSGLAYRLARLYADYNHIHPFREGNGRAGTLLLHAVAALCGRRLDLCAVSREEWYAASRDSMPFRRDGRPNHRPFLPLFAGALC